MMVKVAKERAAVSMAPAPWPSVKAMVASQTADAPRRRTKTQGWREQLGMPIIASAPRS